ncbi:hypothetical protein FRC04_010717 [Tulasnella sp. 424]|nr:hypothetical protein FRC04_010717 [Tulasnella sp. 424]KAG8962751.1 hypothetical protein FRC05_005117 [Tulasnella sp. 425]
MLFRNLLTILPAFVALGVNAIALPSTYLAELVERTPTIDNIVPRCEPCGDGPGIGSGVATGIHTSIDIDATLKLFTPAHLACTQDIVNIFAHVTGDVKATAHVVLGIGAALYTWTDDDLLELKTALDAYIAGTISTGVNIFVKAGIDVAVFTKEQAGCLKAFIATSIETDIDLAVSVKTDLALFVQNSIVVAGATCTDLSTRVQAHLSALVKVVAALKLDAKVATCASAAVAIKLAIKAYVQSCIDSTKGLLAIAVKITLQTLLIVVNAWIKADFGVLTGTAVGLLGINLKTVADVTICKSIVTFLLSLSAKFDLFTSLNLDAATCYQVFSSVVAH